MYILIYIINSTILNLTFEGHSFSLFLMCLNGIFSVVVFIKNFVIGIFSPPNTWVALKTLKVPMTDTDVAYILFCIFILHLISSLNLFLE